MKSPARRRPGAIAIVAMLLVASTVALAIAELLLRAFVSPAQPLGNHTFATAAGKPITPVEAVAAGMIVPVPPPLPMNRPRMMFAPGKTFYLCYSDNQQLRRDWFDDQGRVLVRINQYGLREREEIAPAKPAGQRRIVCLGDSFTFGWGIPEELCWVRLLEHELRKGGGDIRTVNCGAAGTICVDEYWFGLQHRFHVFQPDAVILTICLNDLIPSSGLSLLGPSPATGFRVVDLVLGALGRSPLQLDPERDWVQELLDLPAAPGTAGGLYDPSNKPFEAMWSQGVPQRSLRECKAWCEARKIPFLVVLWPFLQGLGPGRFYPFQKLHDLVASDCRTAGIDFLDVLPALRGNAEEELWVTPGDMHANPLAQRLAMSLILPFVRATTKW